MSVAFETKSRVSVPIEDFDKVQHKNLEKIKHENQVISDLKKVSTFYPETRYKNVVRENEDGTLDIVIDAGVANEISTGFLPKSQYKAIRVSRDKKGLLVTAQKWAIENIIQVSEKDIVSGFNTSLPIEDISEILEANIQQKGAKYFG